MLDYFAVLNAQIQLLHKIPKILSLSSKYKFNYWKNATLSSNFAGSLKLPWVSTYCTCQVSSLYQCHRTGSCMKMAVFWVVASSSLAEVYWRVRSSCCLHQGVDGGSNNFWNVGKLLPDYISQHPRRQPSSYSPPWEPEISRGSYMSTMRAFFLQHLYKQGSSIDFKDSEGPELLVRNSIDILRACLSVWPPDTDSITDINSIKNNWPIFVDVYPPTMPWNVTSSCYYLYILFSTVSTCINLVFGHLTVLTQLQKLHSTEWREKMALNG
jgi:hypothetical protein